MWENAINCPIFLEKSHRFKDDPEWGEIMGRMRMGKDTLEDREEINKHYQPPSERKNVPPEATTAYETNKERNAIEFSAWKTYITEHHPSIHNDKLPPDNVLFVECLIESENKRASNVVHDIAHSRLGDDDIREENTKHSGGAKITPVMRCCPGSIHMVNTNKYLKKNVLETVRSASARQSSSKPVQDLCGKIGMATKFTQYQYKTLNMSTFTTTQSHQRVQVKPFD